MVAAAPTWDIESDVPLAPHTTLGVGGPARLFARVRSTAELQQILAWARQQALRTFVLGGGSNVLIADAGFDGLVVQLEAAACTSTLRPDGVWLRAEAGMAWDALAAQAVAAGWAGMECLAGIPGRVGAVPIQNVGAYGQEVADTVRAIEVVARDTGEVSELGAAACAFGYRDSAFKGAWRDRYVITAVTFCLRPGGGAPLRYGELARALDVRAGGASPSLAVVREVVLTLRRAKSMVYDVGDANHRSAGSFFTNPIVPVGQAEALLQAHAGMPVFDAYAEHKKLSAGWLIEHAGFTRGWVQGRVGLSTQHALALINRGGATAAELVSCAAQIRRAVHARFQVTLAAEPVLVGFAVEPALLEALA